MRLCASQKQELALIYSELYYKLNDLTPLQIDCGELCGSRCCTGEVGEGIFLFPGEEIMFENKPYWENMIEINGMLAVTCDGQCPREERPLICRLFPLFPYISAEGEFEIRFYSQLAIYCPLIQLGDFSLLASDYVDQVREVTNILCAIPVCNEFIQKISRQIDSFESEPWTNLFRI